MARRPSEPQSSPFVVDALAYLQRLVDHEISSVGISAGVIEGLTLEPVRQVLDALGRPDRSYRIVHITGTNGKGSVARMVESLVEADGLRAGAYLSPEGTPNERIRIDGHPIGDDALADAVSSVRGAADHLGVTLSAFDAVTLSALVAFADAPVDVAVVEVGLLGRFDSTNVVDGDVAVVTNVGGDHTDFAEGWRDRVAWEKAGIVKPGCALVTGRVDDDLIGHFTAEGPGSVARLGHDVFVEDRLAYGGRQARITTSRGSEFDVLVPLHGVHQADNAALAVEAVEALLDAPLPDEVVEAAFDAVRAPGRVEVVRREPVVIVDGAHNPDAAASLGRTLAEAFVVAGRRTAVVAMLAGRSPVDFLSALVADFPVDLVVAASLPAPRGQPAAAIAAAAEELGIAVVVSTGVGDAVARAVELADEDDLVVVSGSFRVIDDARAAALASHG